MFSYRESDAANSEEGEGATPDLATLRRFDPACYVMRA